MQPDLAKQFSLEHLISGSQPLPASSNRESANAPASSPPEFGKILDLLSAPILRELESAPNHEMRLFELSDKLVPVYGDIPMPTLVEIINFLDSTKRLSIVERQRHGNHLVKLV